MQRVVRILGFTLISVLAAMIPIASVAAISDATLDKFAENNILFYDPSDSEPSDDCDDGPGGGSLNLNTTIDDLPASVVKKLDNENWVKKANANKERYKYAESKTGVSWLIMASIHYREGGMDPRKTILNGELFRDHDYVNKDGHLVSSDPNKDAKNAAQHLIDMGKMVYKVDASKDHSLKSLAWASLAYNRGFRYKNWATPSVPYTKSPYVVNYFDSDHMGMYFPSSIIEPEGTRGKKDANVGFLTMLVYLNGRIGGSTSGGSTGKESTASSKNGSNITLIGDSIANATKAKFLEAYPKADVHAQDSKQFYGKKKFKDNPQGNFILKDLKDKSKLRKVLIYALGTNDPGLTKKQAQKIVKAAGSSTTILFITNYSTGTDFTGNNNVLQKMKDDNKNVVLVDWAGAVKDDPGKYLSDGTHPTEEGVKLWVQLVSEALNSGETNNSVNKCGDGPGGNTSAGVTKYTYKGHEYAFPLVGATKANVLNNKNKAGKSDLSPLPCQNYTGCHHNSPAVDTGLRATMAGYKASKYDPSDKNFLYYSTGVKVVALVAGKITKISGGYNSIAKCAAITYQGDDGRSYWIGHTYLDPDLKAGDKFTAGQEMTMVYTPQCALGSQAHIHVNTTKGTCTRDNRSGCTKDAIDIINAGYNALPEK